MATSRIDEYRIVLLGKDDDSYDRVANILCYSGDDYVARLSFYYPGSIPINRFFSSEKIGLNYSIEQLPNVLDILRNESPLYVTLSSSSSKGWLHTSQEDVGEAE